MSAAERVRPWGEIFALAVPLGVALVELALREGYHRFSSEPAHFAYVLAAAAISLSCAWFIEAGWSGSAVSQILKACNRLLGWTVWIWVVPMRGTSISGRLTDASVAEATIAAVFLGGLAWLAFSERQWSKVRPAMLLAMSLFVLSQPLLGRLSSPSLFWPERIVPDTSPSVTSMRAPDGTNVLILLLDELNARQGAELAAVLAAHGMAVSQKAITPVADSTAKVIPQLWTGTPFADPKPCSFTAICSEGHALDFAKVSASRADIDVVGFYHPYCAMRGLRWCRRVSQALPIGQAGRWHCAMASRLGLSKSAGCQATQNDPFLSLRSETLDAFWQAPFWRQGGLFFAHLPLPHPPGAKHGGTLAQDYKANLDLASDLLGKVVDRGRAAGLARLRVIVFSDHPLRQALWCGKPPYSEQGCEPQAALKDQKVPLIVATLGAGPVDLRSIESNAQVFELASLP